MSADKACFEESMPFVNSIENLSSLAPSNRRRYAIAAIATVKTARDRTTGVSLIPSGV